MMWYEDEVRQLERTLAERHRLNRDRPVVFYGSSSIRLWTTLAQDFPELQPLNLGFGGSTLAACTWFFDRLVLPVQPRALVFYAGDNDLGDGRHPEEVCLFYEALLRKLGQQLPDMPFSFIAIKPSPARWALLDRIRFVNNRVEQLARQTPGHQYIDVFTPMLSAQGGPRRELFETDGLHLNGAGYALWRQVLSQYSLTF